MPLARLVLDVSDEPFLVHEAGGDALGVTEHPASIVSDVEDNRAAVLELVEDVVQSALARPAGEASVVNVSDASFGKRRVVKSAGDGIVPSEVVLLYLAVKVVRIVEIPVPVARHIEGRDKVGVSIFQFVEHGTQRVEQGVLAHCVGDERQIAVVGLVPVDLFVFEETVVFVDDLPKRLEVLAGRPGILVRLLAPAQ